MRSRGSTLHPDTDAAMVEAVRLVNVFKGNPSLQPEPREFAQKLVMDSLALAPSPIGRSWIRLSLAAAAQLGRWLHQTGQPLTREHALAEDTLYRWAQTLTHMTEASANLMWTRMTMTREFFDTGATRRYPKPTRTNTDIPFEPMSATEIADVWIWASNMRPVGRRLRLQITLSLGLGCGLSGGEMVKVARNDVTRDNTGVHVTVHRTSDATTRVVTCTRRWEERLWDAVQQVTPGRFLFATGSTKPPTARSAHNMIYGAAIFSPAHFNPTRLRNTWLAGHLEAGTPIHVLLEASGLAHAQAFNGMLPYLTQPTPDTATAWLRGDRP